MKIEILYYNYFIFGDNANVTFLQKCLPDAEFIFTEIADKPYFSENEPDLIYMGAMSESNQERVIGALRPYVDRINELTEKGVHFLFTANACDILGNFITTDGKNKTEALGIFDFSVDRKMFKRFNGFTLGTYNGIEIVGYMSQFGRACPKEGFSETFFKVDRGSGINKGIGYEGFKRNNLIATYLIGPFLLINPLFTKAWLKEITGNDITIPFESVATDCYEKRLAEFKDPERLIDE